MSAIETSWSVNIRLFHSTRNKTNFSQITASLCLQRWWWHRKKRNKNENIEILKVRMEIIVQLNFISITTSLVVIETNVIFSNIKKALGGNDRLESFSVVKMILQVVHRKTEMWVVSQYLPIILGYYSCR